MRGTGHPQVETAQEHLSPGTVPLVQLTQYSQLKCMTSVLYQLLR